MMTYVIGDTTGPELDWLWLRVDGVLEIIGMGLL